MTKGISGTIFFDIGGPLINEYYFNRRFDQILIKKLNRNNIKISYKNLHTFKEQAVSEYAPHYHKRVLKLAVGDNTELYELFLPIIIDAMNKSRNLLCLRKGALEVLKYLKTHWHLGISSKLPNNILLNELKRFNLLDFFNIINTSDSSFRKPDVRFFRYLISQAEGKETWMVGNRIDVDIFPANEVGMKTVLIKVGTHKNQQPINERYIQDITIVHLRRLISIL